MGPRNMLRGEVNVRVYIPGCPAKTKLLYINTANVTFVCSKQHQNVLKGQLLFK